MSMFRRFLRWVSVEWREIFDRGDAQRVDVEAALKEARNETMTSRRARLNMELEVRTRR